MKLQPLMPEVAGWFGVHVETLQREIKKKYQCTFVEARERFGAGSKMNLRRAQIRNAVENMDTRMQIHLGKNWLGQTDKVENKVDVSETLADIIRKAHEEEQAEWEGEDE
jgi:hypothetical protein